MPLKICFLTLTLSLFLSYPRAYAQTPATVESSPDIVTETKIDEKDLLIKQLGADNVEDRDKAEQIIWKRGKEFLPLLETASSSDDPEIAERANRLIPKISLALKPDKSTDLGEFSDKYSVANADDRSEMISEFLERESLTAREIKAALRMQIKMAGSPEEAMLNDWQLQKLGKLLQKESTKLIFEGKMDDAMELWNDIDFSPQIRHKYVAMLFHAGKPLDKSRFEDMDIRAAEAELALLEGNVEKARTLAPEGDTYLAQRIIAADFDLGAKWKLALASTSLDDSTIQMKSQLPLLWADARSKGDKETQEKAIAQIIEFKPTEEGEALLLEEVNPDDGFPGEEVIPYGKIEAANLLIACGEEEPAARLIMETLPEATPEKTLSIAYSIVRSPKFDPKLLGARDNTPEAIVELAATLSPLEKIPAPKKNTAPATTDNKSPSQADMATMVKLLCIGNYMDARGEGSQITPYILSHIIKVPRSSRNILAQYYIIALNAFGAKDLAYDLFRMVAERDIIPEQSQEICELNIAYGNFRSRNTRKQWDALYPLASVLVNDPKNRAERLDALFCLLKVIPDKDNKRPAFLKKAQEYLKNHSKDEGMDLLAETLTALLLKYDTNSQNVLSIPETLGRPVLLDKNDFIPQADQLIALILKSGSEPLKESYRQTLTKKGSTSPEANDNRQEDPAQWNEYLSLFLETKDPALAQKMKQKARFLSTSETESRSRNAFCSYQTGSARELLKRAFPSYIVELDDALNDSYSSPQFKGAQGAFMINPCLRDSLYKEACFFVESTMEEITTSPVFNIMMPSHLVLIRGMGELSRGLLEYREGKKEQAMESFELANRLLSGSTRLQVYLLILSDYPELKELCTKWFEQDYSKMASNKKHWPNDQEWQNELIFPGLILNHRTEEMRKLFENHPKKESLSPLYEALNEFLKGNREKAITLMEDYDKAQTESYAKLLIKLFRSTYDPHATATASNKVPEQNQCTPTPDNTQEKDSAAPAEKA